MPKLPDDTTAIEAFASKTMQWGLYVLMFAQPLSGIMMSQAAGYSLISKIYNKTKFIMKFVLISCMTLSRHHLEFFTTLAVLMSYIRVLNEK